MSERAADEAVLDAGGRIFARDELGEFDGKDGAPAYIAINGIVYDAVIPGVDIDQLNKGVCNFMFRTNYPDFAGLNTFQSVAYFSTGITTIFVLEES